MDLVITQEDAQGIADYLKLRPWAEVDKHMKVLLALQPNGIHNYPLDTMTIPVPPGETPKPYDKDNPEGMV